MLFTDSLRRIWLFTKPTDMRKSFDGLTALVRNELNERPLSGDWFVFVNNRKTLLKVLYFDGSGFCIWLKRLEQGQFNCGTCRDKKRRLKLTDLQLILDGIKIEKARQYKRFRIAD